MLEPPLVPASRGFGSLFRARERYLEDCLVGMAVNNCRVTHTISGTMMERGKVGCASSVVEQVGQLASRSASRPTSSVVNSSLCGSNAQNHEILSTILPGLISSLFLINELSSSQVYSFSTAARVLTPTQKLIPRCLKKVGAFCTCRRWLQIMKSIIMYSLRCL